MGDNSIAIKTQVPASKKLSAPDARSLLKDASKLHVAKGKKLSVFDVSDALSDEAVAAMLGPTGNLRAPTIVRGKTLIVGYNEALFAKLLG
ncbi:MAG: hypothetical protein HOC23_03545 [Halieaceae bacterium]|nr:hypothetical protein [Halieaceae bacterium]